MRKKVEHLDFHKLFSPIEKTYFLPLLFLNIISALAYSICCQTFSELLYMCSLGALLAYIESFVTCLPPFDKRPVFVVIIFVTITDVLIIADYFCILEFGKPINQDVVDIILETHTDEISQFTSAYFSVRTVMLILSVAAINVLLFAIGKVGIIRKAIGYLMICLLIVGLYVSSRSVLMFALYRNGMSVPQYTALSRICYSLYISSTIKNGNQQLIRMVPTVEAQCTAESPANIVLIIGESLNIHHSQLYGYERRTQPLLTHRAEVGELTVFKDVVAGSDHTASALYSIFSVDDSLPMGQVPLFPMVFKNAGYGVELWDNQYITGRGVSFLSDRGLSDALYDKRNTYTGTDGQLIDMMIEALDRSVPKLYIIHLMGQHYTYAHRYPEDFAVFEPQDYQVKDIHQAKTLAAYDNAVYYGDYITERIIRAFEDSESAIVFISDHGEEIFDIDSFCGHGNAHIRENKSYQLHVPMFIWLSEKFNEHHPEIKERVNAASIKKMHQRDVSQMLIGLAALTTPWAVPSRDIINSLYDEDKPRIVLKTYNYDKQ